MKLGDGAFKSLVVAVDVRRRGGWANQRHVVEGGHEDVAIGKVGVEKIVELRV